MKHLLNTSSVLEVNIQVMCTRFWSEPLVELRHTILSLFLRTVIVRIVIQ